jgi:hypothetical protein
MLMHRARRTQEGKGQYEYYSVYKYREKLFDHVFKHKLKPRWAWRTFFPITTLEGMPDKAQLLELVEEKNEHDVVIGRKYVPTSTFDPKNKKHFVKTPPYYRAVSKPDRSTRAKRRALKDARRLEKLERSQAHTPESNGERV